MKLSMFSLSSTDLTRDQKEYLQSLLQSGETLLWAGTPVRRLPLSVVLQSAVILLSLAVSAALFASSGLAAAMADAVDKGEIPPLFILAFIAPLAALLCVALLRPLWCSYCLQHSLYAVTDRRYISACDYPLIGRKHREWAGQPVAVTTEKDGSGDIVMEYREQHLENREVRRIPIGLMRVPNIAQVQAAIAARSAAAAEAEKSLAEAAIAEALAADPAANTAKRAPKFLGPLLLVLSAAAWAFALESVVSTNDRISTYEKAAGTVTHLEEIDNSASEDGPRYLYRAHYVFEVGGKEYVGQQASASNPPTHIAGEEVEILYDPNNPQESYTDSLFELYGVAVFSAVSGLFFGLCGLLCLWTRRHAKQAVL